MKKTKIELVVVKGHKLDGTGAIVVTIDPQFADFCQDVFLELVRLLGHERIAVFPLPDNAIKFYSVKAKEQINVQIATDIKPVIGDLNNG